VKEREEGRGAKNGREIEIRNDKYREERKEQTEGESKKSK
jgi:hypothetical protein